MFSNQFSFLLFLITAYLAVITLSFAGQDNGEAFENSLGMEMVSIPEGSFMMGEGKGDYGWDELPVHKVKISSSFYMSATEVTNAQYEQFDPSHKKLRRKKGFSTEDDEAVIFVSWEQAGEFCEWLSEKEGKPYRLPTEAEWEYACRAGTKTSFSTGSSLPKAYHKNQQHMRTYKPVGLEVGQTPANPWGLYDMHGNVEEWCWDWYGEYPEEKQIDPVGREGGIMKVTRGGSHSTDPYYLRSANRMGTLPEDTSWLIGFRVVMAEFPGSEPLPQTEKSRCLKTDSQKDYDWSNGPDQTEPYFEGPIQYLRRPAENDGEPFYSHNHCPSITWCDNGDLLAVWFSTKSEKDRDMVILSSRLRAGSSQWERASLFYKAPDRNMTGSSLFNDGNGTLYHFNGLDVAYHWRHLAITLRTSTDNGSTWSRPRLISPEHGFRNQVISGTIMTSDGVMVQACDAGSGGSDGTAVHISTDHGKTWTDPAIPQMDGREPEYKQGNTGYNIAGIHAGVAELNNGNLMAFGRSNNINGYMPCSISEDMGKTWRYSASEFPPISSGQRLVLMRLDEGPLLFVSFTDTRKSKEEGWPCLKGMLMKDAEGNEHRMCGMYAALSFDEGKSWPVKKLITAGDPPREIYGAGWTGKFTMDQRHAEPGGYLAATQTPDGVIHLISSAQHYRFNLAWLREPMVIDEE
ncbi:Serine/threonine-protein kinase pkn1 [Sedimentisphaera salicampi]|nr:SUMF1/EgtB/PvdO family nonheme iron enzyme [Sedimentisphaera salicampi]OXU15162.1 Serine/threonine-protein kinase pkn1 [Sedimentisphaera salicampi]